MLAALLESMPIAIGIILATFPLIGVSLLLVNRPDLVAYLAFLAGWITGAVMIGTIAITVSDLSTPGEQQPAIWVIWLRLFLGVVLIALAGVKIITRKPAQHTHQAPGWFSAFQEMRPFKTFGIGLGLSAVNPKNAALFASGALTIAAKTYAPLAQFIALLAFASISSAGLALPMFLAILSGENAKQKLKRLSQFMTRYSSVIVSVVLAILGIIILKNAMADLQAYPTVL